MLDVKKLLTKIMECFVIQTSGDSSGDWRYVQIGRLFIGARSFTGTLTISTAVGGIYQTAANSTISFPLTLSQVIYADVKVATSSYGVWSYLVSTTTSSVSYRAMSAISRSSASYTISALVVGIV